MLMAAIIIFAIAAILGAILITHVLQDKPTPKGIVILHGPLAATGLFLLIVYAFLHAPAPIASIVLFILAACGGFVLLYQDLTGKPLVKGLAVGHAFLALIGFIFLLVFTFF